MNYLNTANSYHFVFFSFEIKLIGYMNLEEQSNYMIFYYNSIIILKHSTYEQGFAYSRWRNRELSGHSPKKILSSGQKNLISILISHWATYMQDLSLVIDSTIRRYWAGRRFCIEVDDHSLLMSGFCWLRASEMYKNVDSKTTRDLKDKTSLLLDLQIIDFFQKQKDKVLGLSI